MHKFLRAVGFSEITKQDLQKIIDEILAQPDTMKIARDSEGNDFAQLTVFFAPNVGVTLCGAYQGETVEPDYCYPCMYGTSITTKETVDVEKHAEKESYAGVCDELSLGVTLIFYLQNVAEYLSESHHHLPKTPSGAALAGLSTEGTVLCPVYEKNPGRSPVAQRNEQRSKLVAQAREGDELALESLTIEDMDMYAEISERVAREDVFSIVKSTFMPYGIESDQYSVLGEIKKCVCVENKWTHEKIYVLKLLCNDICFDVCINEKDLYGEPAVGRRFRGNVWMQGRICYV